jgi:leucyl aminopeptidase
MKVSIVSNIAPAEALFVFIPQKKWDKKPFEKLLPTSLEKQIAGRLKEKDFKGEQGEIIQIFPSLKGSKKTFLVGTGEGKEITDIRKSAGSAIRKSKKIKAGKVAFLLSEKGDVGRMISGAILGNYEFKVGDTKEQFSPKTLIIITTQKHTKAAINSEIALAEATNLTRELINLPANMMTPAILAKKSKAIGKASPVSVKVMGEKEIKKLKMGSFAGVGQGSAEESQLIVFEYNGGKKSEKPIAFVGKGVCFDSGGYNIKPTGHIEEMKSDMGGAATVAGLFQWIAKAKPKKNVIGVIGAVENLVSSNAYKPGDYITAMNGKTIEITNTDAEGRLVLADCLYYTATKYKPIFMVDIATLTGAAIAALGYEITPIMGNNSAKIQQVRNAAEKADEDVWELPITNHFREKVKGTNTDLLNWTAGISAGSPMAGAFLEQFVEKTPWVHIDTAGTAFHAKTEDSITPKGATGVILRTLKYLVQA